MIILLALIITTSFTTVLSRYCVDDKKGWCRGHDIWGWCFHNKTDGRFDCDEEGFCAGQEQLKNKKSTGCFLRGNNTVCCCNEAEIDVGLTSVQRGCRSRKTLVHHIAKDQYTKFKNNTNWMDTERLVSLPTCADITWGAEWINGTQSMCLDFNFEEDDVEKKGRLCCCRGNHKCNDRFMWGDEGITKEELSEILQRRDRVVNVSSRISATAAVLLALYFVT
ncbi:hypothetical protein RB195_004119 [Necator americanus]|uniref:Uncharacterized protein n=1 Tax=Necator americanus TaxID=51031 RepID=A0ABR1BKG0_NECAM